MEFDTTDLRLERIRELNDAARRRLRDCTVFVTRGIAAMPQEDQREILSLVRVFDAFTLDNDPYGEHDFGAFDYDGNRIFWKIDCYDHPMRFGSPDPANPDISRGGCRLRSLGGLSRCLSGSIRATPLGIMAAGPAARVRPPVSRR